jgi:hypothetical protein
MPLDKTAILETLQALDRRDPQRRIFGSVVHQYRLNPPVPVTVLEAFEKKHGISFPEDYKQFITAIGNGGAGPFYGLFPFGEHDNCDGLCKWEDGFLMGNVAEPFRHTEAWNLRNFGVKNPIHLQARQSNKKTA